MSTKSSTEKELLIQYLSLMDIDKIDLILDDHVLCFGASKAIFLNKLKFIFNQCRLSGAKENPTIVNVQKGSNQYRMILPEFDESIEINIAEHRGRIVKLYNNLDAKNWKQVEDLTPFDLCFGLDEHVGFQPSADYLILYSQCLEAIKELIPSETKVYTSNELRSWLNKFKSQYLEVGKHFYYFKFSEFKKLYEALQFLIQRLVHHPEVKRALSEYHDLGHYSPIDWYRNYERLFYERVLCFDQVFDKIDFEKRILQMGTTSASYYFTGDDFFDLVDFNEIYTNPNP